jgi:hypothetical protein
MGPGQFWASIDQLLGWVQGDRVPVLVTTAAPNTPRSIAGTFSDPNTRTLFGGNNLNQKARSGLHLAAGYWLDGDHISGIEAGFFMLESKSTGIFATSDGTTILARPFTDATTGQPSSSLVGFPGSASGSIHALDAGRNFWGGNIDLRENIWATGCWRLDALLGYRFLRYDEHITVQSTINPISGPFVSGTSIVSTDFFGTRNTFNGLDLGLKGEVQYNDWSLEVLGKIPAGYITRHVTIGGTQVVSVPGTDPVTSQGGLLALSSNIGKFPGHTLTVAPEVGFNLSYQVTQNIRVGIGYSVLWMLSVARPGDQIDTTINPGLIPPPTPAAGSPFRPLFTKQFDDLWVQTINFSCEVRY